MYGNKTEMQTAGYVDSSPDSTVHDALLEYGDVSYPEKQDSLAAFPYRLGFRKVSSALALVGFFLFIVINVSGVHSKVAAAAAVASSRNGAFSKQTVSTSACSPEAFKCHIDEAVTRFNKMQARQSKTKEEAVAHYRTRYGRAPPPGFEDWVAFAFANNATIIDDYDRIEADLQPFRSLGLTQKQIYARMASAWDKNRFVAQPSEALGHLTVKDGKLHLGDHLIQEDFTGTVRRVLDPIVSKLPDLTILYNWYDEPRLVLPSEKGGKPDSDIVEWEDYSHTSTWDVVRRPCETLSQSTSPRYTFPLSEQKDVCTISSSQRNRHGFYVAPANFHMTQDIFPMLSSAKVSTMGDILTPSPSYFTEKYRMWTLNDTIPFEDKSKSVYWSGSSTGMVMIHKHWTEGQRQRFALQMKKMQEGVIAAKDASSSHMWPEWFKETIPGSTLVQQLSSLPSNVSAVGFIAMFHCDALSCQEADESLPHRAEEPASASFNHQIVADLDGEGMSGRFYRLISSNSLPLKQTIWLEWHDERVLPWVHYIPLSLDMSELTPLLAWLLGTQEGQQYGAFIANEGRTWSQSSLRQIDATIYLYRLLLEYARILNTTTE